jgi:FkbM family methyltransferase
MDKHDKKNFSLLSSLISDGDVIVDVGSHEGLYTSFFLEKIKNTGKVYSIELSNSTFEVLRKNVSRFNNIILMNCAISNVDGQIKYYESKKNHLNNIMGHDVLYNKQEMKGVITSMRLDTLLKNEKKIKLVKIDVEGAEHLVLEGMEKIVDRIEYILVECHLNEYWGVIKDILLNKYSFSCINNSADVNSEDKLNENSKLMYQCFCKRV